MPRLLMGAEVTEVARRGAVAATAGAPLCVMTTRTVGASAQPASSVTRGRCAWRLAVADTAAVRRARRCATTLPTAAASVTTVASHTTDRPWVRPLHLRPTAVRRSWAGRLLLVSEKCGVKSVALTFKSPAPGDWFCTACSASNFARRNECFKCNAARPGGESHGADRGGEREYRRSRSRSRSRDADRRRRSPSRSRSPRARSPEPEPEPEARPDKGEAE